MSQLNMQMTPDFEENLRQFMAVRGFGTKSEAIRRAIEEGLARTPMPPAFDWSSLRGKGLGPGLPQFSNNDDLWNQP